MEFKFDTDTVTPSEFEGLFFVISKVGEKLINQTQSLPLNNLILSLIAVRKNYISTVQEVGRGNV